MSHNQLYILVIIFFVVANFEVWFLNFWQNKETAELTIMKNRMIATSAGETPRGVLAEPTSPYYELLEHSMNYKVMFAIRNIVPIVK
ncbi:hypothetical protein LEUM_0587 [Leuconostoc mesenteroides subsp. mesenteroides ATCC 8293]|uniref:Uncharacterized protein n=1 Tax=Leuconostoc mesenteroides subsp. mesenteroides (strain ATCC 8293 / DSM 20343 / BCRC 11652 / CCM 1803 / JCM 6124 / NCDO 523 / NBRC 100496 / NCIMB 8023 / NCTC 12954 / NRRL B-1118 / 37Y) TaxID=203120 RepID=Q03YM1_LEUMM|nr:hypothetical protein LEUM_0587 [Leuconostoc mesenteroides subsp. mesenteroides ATCC 8293]